MPADRFWAKVAVGLESECWPWAGTRNDSGYGLFWGRIEKRWLRAHRVSYEIANGAIPDGLFICHRCDNPPCVNPAHLFAGTQFDNMSDCASKGRVVSNGPTGDDHWTRQPFAGMTPAERFWSQVECPPNACWVWPRLDGTEGYGQYWDPEGEHVELAHRHAWALTHGPIPDGGRLAHICGNRACVNPDHLFAGTLAEFFRAHPERKPTYAKRVGVENPAAKLNPERVTEIRCRHAGGETFKDLAAAYDISAVSIRNVVRRKTWAHVP